MQREVLDGIPYLISKERNVYYYSVTPSPGETPIQIGTKSADGKLALFANAQDILSSQLKGYRESSTSRSRKR